MSPESEWLKQRGMELWDLSYSVIGGRGAISKSALEECQLIGRAYDKVNLADKMLQLKEST